MSASLNLIAAYRAAGPEERRRIQLDTVALYAPRIARLAQKAVGSRHCLEAAQVGAAAVALALEMGNPKQQGGEFWSFAQNQAHKAIVRWYATVHLMRAA